MLQVVEVDNKKRNIWQEMMERWLKDETTVWQASKICGMLLLKMFKSNFAWCSNKKCWTSNGIGRGQTVMHSAWQTNLTFEIVWPTCFGQSTVRPKQKQRQQQKGTASHWRWGMWCDDCEKYGAVSGGSEFSKAFGKMRVYGSRSATKRRKVRVEDREGNPPSAELNTLNK